MITFAWRRLLCCALASGLLAMAAPTFAHSPLLATVPANGSTVAAPTVIAVEFKQATRLAKLTVLPPEGEAIALDLSAHKQFATRHEVSTAGLHAGEHRVQWRVLARDGHVMKGEFAFTVR